jgi:hypothetical protein
VVEDHHGEVGKHGTTVNSGGSGSGSALAAHVLHKALLT